MQSLFDLLYSNVSEGWLTIWTLPDRRTFWADLSLSDYHPIEKAEQYAAQRSAEGADVYFGIGLRRQMLPTTATESPRGSATDVSVLTTLFVDIDVRDPAAHKKTTLPESFEAAYLFLDELPLRPSAVVRSGHGLHVYWVLREPILIADAAGMRDAAALLAGWEDFVYAQAARYGWKFDEGICELARVLRVPGTLNHKGGAAVPVTLEPQNGNSYDISEFQEWISTVQAAGGRCAGTVSSAAALPTVNHGPLSPDEELVQGYMKPKVDIPTVLPEGERNIMLFKLAASLRAKGLTDIALEAALQAENVARCVPPLDEKEVHTIAHSAAKYMPGTTAEQAQAAAVAQLQEVGDTAADILADTTLDAIVAIADEVERYRQIAKLRMKAKPLGIIKEFESTIKAKIKKANAARAAADPDSADTNEFIVLEGIPVKGLRQTSWKVTEEGIKRVKYVEGEPVATYACAHPVIITERMLNVDSGLEHLGIAFRRDGSWHSIAVNRSVAASKNSIVQLADTGIMVNTENAKHLVQFLHDLEQENIDVIPLRKSVSRAGWIGHKRDTFSPYASDIAFDGELSYRDMYQAIRTEGSFHVWTNAVEEARQANLVVRLALAASFASPLVGLLGKPIFFLHLWGDTGTGKSVALQLVESVWGNPMKLIKTFNNTAVGLERAAAFMHSLPLALDEFQTLQRAKFDVDNLLYTLAEGKSRGRGTRGGGMEVESSWANIIITNGEEPMTTDRSGGGAKNRALELSVKGNLFGNAPAFADLLHENYGFAGMQYIFALIDEVKANGTKEIQGHYQAFRETYNVAAGYTDKQSNAMALLCTGDYYASRWVFGMDEAQAFEEASKLNLDAMPLMATIKDVDQVQNAWDWLQTWLASNKEHFIGWAQDKDTWRTPWFGDFDNQKLYILKPILDKALEEAGYSARKSAAGWADRKYTATSMDGEKLRYTVKHRVNDIPAWCYCLKTSYSLLDQLASGNSGNGVGT